MSFTSFILYNFAAWSTCSLVGSLIKACLFLSIALELFKSDSQIFKPLSFLVKDLLPLIPYKMFFPYTNDLVLCFSVILLFIILLIYVKQIIVKCFLPTIF